MEMKGCHHDVLCLVKTKRFSVVGTADGGDDGRRCGSSNQVDLKNENFSSTSRRLGVFLDIDEHYTRTVIQKAFRHPQREQYFHIVLGPGVGMDAVVIPEQCEFQWAEYERIDWDAVQAGKHKASSYMIRKGLSRKAQLAYYTRLYVCKHPNSILKDAIPKTIILDTWSVWDDDTSTTITGSGGLADVIVSIGGTSDKDNISHRKRLDSCLADARIAMEEADKDYEAGLSLNAPVWILKGSTVNKGAGIHIVHHYEQIVDHCWTESDIREWVLQRYIDCPLLLHKRKFHIRAYVLAVSALRVYMSRDCLALCSGTRYSRNNTSNLFSHITNTAYQDLDPNFREDKCILLWDEHDIPPILIKDKVCENVSDAVGRVNKVIDDMSAIIGELFRVYQNELGVFSPIDGCFEHYGLDFVVDENWNVYLLEVNPGPDFKQTGSRLQSAIENLMGSTVDIVFSERDGSQSSLPFDLGNMMLCYESDGVNR